MQRHVATDNVNFQVVVSENFLNVRKNYFDFDFFSAGFVALEAVFSADFSAALTASFSFRSRRSSARARMSAKILLTG